MQHENSDSPFYTAEEAAKALRISKTSLYTRVKAGDIKATRIGRIVLISKEYIAELAKGQECPA